MNQEPLMLPLPSLCSPQTMSMGMPMTTYLKMFMASLLAMFTEGSVGTVTIGLI